MTHELKLKQWHHGYLGLMIMATSRFMHGWLRLAFLAVGWYIFVDDALQHLIQWKYDDTYQSPLKYLYRKWIYEPLHRRIYIEETRMYVLGLRYLQQNWTLVPIKEVDKLIREEFDLPRYWFYAGFNNVAGLVEFAPFWLVPWARWRDRIPFLRRRWERKQAERHLKANRDMIQSLTNYKGPRDV